MKGDFTRFTHDLTKHYAKVLKQQGRVDLDADWNEYAEIQEHLEQTTNTDVIGPCGVPRTGGGFMIGAAPGDDLTISPGRIYVDGILCELEAEAEATYLDQPDYPNPPALDSFEGHTHLVYLDVWQRHITAIEDPDIREVALGGPDTTTRVKTVWQVKILSNVGSIACEDQIPEQWPPLPPLLQRGQLSTQTVSPPADEDPCVIAPGGGYRGLENRLYRVEIHDGGQAYTWPRPAAAEATAVTGIADGAELTVSDWTVGRQAWHAGQMVELYSDKTDASDQAGVLARIQTTDQAGSTLTLDTDVSSMVDHANLRLRRIATFKWARDNGSVVFAIKEFVPGEPTKVRVKDLGRDQVLTLHADDWVEVLGDETELKGVPGTLAAIAPDGIDEAELILTLTLNVSHYDGEEHPKVRRWDQKGAAIPITTEVLELEDGIQIQFGGQDLQTGDYWSFAARTATGRVEELIDASPLGIEHAYCRLALIRQDEEGFTDIEDCRPTFPTLTEICAEDVCYDDSRCDAVQAETVQEVLDQLCAMRDLRHHNKHLHGWGIVCGLQVHCGPDNPEISGDRTTVTLRPGYAIDCEGNDIVLDEAMSVPILELIEKWKAEHEDEPLLEDGEGQVCLILERDEHGQPRVALRPYDPDDNTLQAMLKGTLWMDFVQDCIVEPWKEIRELLFPPPEEEDDENLVGDGQRQLITMLNLVIQLWNPEYGSHVYLSLKEHKILKELYLALRFILQSKTFCAMFDKARPLPDYPIDKARMSTIFDAARNRTRLRIHPDGRLGYSLGVDDKIHVYDLEAEELIAILDMPGGTGLVAQDVAFSENGRQLYAIGTLQDKDSIVAAATIDGLEHKWQPVVVLCGVQLLTLVQVPAGEDTVRAVGRGDGLYTITLGDVESNIKLSVGFNAVGHMVVDAEGTHAYASAANSEEGGLPIAYDRVLEIDLATFQTQEYPLMEGETSLTGQDDIAIVTLEDTRKVYAVAYDPDARKKLLFIFLQDNPEKKPDILELPNTAIRLGSVPDGSHLMVTAEDHYSVYLVELAGNSLLADYRLPVQFAPVAIAVDPTDQQVYVINALSPTLTKIAAEHMQPPEEGSEEPAPGTEGFLNVLFEYRQGIFDAYTDLVGGLLQYLKDCFCQHLLIDCPECAADDEVYLASVAIKESEVYQVCNFSRRRYVKSFPTVGYWLSLIPIAPLVHKAVEYLCCLVLPEHFGRVTAPQRDAYQAPVKSYQVRTGLAAYQQGALQRQVSEVLGQVNLAQRVTGDWVSHTVAKAVTPVERRTVLTKNEVVGQPVEVAVKRAEEKQVIAKIEAYDASRGATNLLRLTQAPLRVSPGTEVTFYEQNGVVRYYALSEKPPEEVKALRTKLDAQGATLAEVETLKTNLSRMQELLARKDKDFVAMRNKLQALEAKQAKLEAAPELVKVSEIEAELKELRTLREEVKQFMERPGG